MHACVYWPKLWAYSCDLVEFTHNMRVISTKSGPAAARDWLEIKPARGISGSNYVTPLIIYTCYAHV